MKYVKRITILLALLICATSASAADFSSILPQHLNNEEYNESWYFHFRFDNGWVIFSTSIINNLGPGDKLPSFNATIIPPGGKPVVYQGRHDSDELTLKTSPARVDMKTSFIGAEGENLRFHFNESGAEADILITPMVLGPTKPQRYQIAKDRSDFYEVSAPIIRGKAVGYVVVDGKKTEVIGEGYFDHVRSNTTLAVVASRAERVILWGDKLSAVAMLISAREGQSIKIAYCSDSGDKPTGAAFSGLPKKPGGKTYLQACGKKILLSDFQTVQTIHVMDNLNFFERAALSVMVGSPEVNRSFFTAPGGRGFVDLLYIK